MPYLEWELYLLAREWWQRSLQIRCDNYWRRDVLVTGFGGGARLSMEGGGGGGKFQKNSGFLELHEELVASDK